MASGFPERSTIGIASRFPKHTSLFTHGIEGTTRLSSCSSVGGHLEVFRFFRQSPQSQESCGAREPESRRAAGARRVRRVGAQRGGGAEEWGENVASRRVRAPKFRAFCFPLVVFLVEVWSRFKAVDYPHCAFWLLWGHFGETPGKPESPRRRDPDPETPRGSDPETPETVLGGLLVTSDETSKIPLCLRASCNLVSSSSQRAISSSLCFFDNLRHFSGPKCVASSVILHFCGSTVHPFVSFWQVGPQRLESCHSNTFSREHIFTLLMPRIVQRVVRSFVNACSRLPHHAKVFERRRNTCLKNCVFARMRKLLFSCRGL